MHPYLHVPGPLLGLLLLVAAPLWVWFWRRKPTAKEREPWTFGLALGAVGLVLVSGLIAPLRTIVWPTYGFAMLLGCLAVTLLGVRWVTRRGLLKMEHMLELLLVGGVAGLVCARAVFLIESWDTHFADRPPAIASPGPQEPLAAGDRLLLRTHAGEATVTFTGEERTLAAIEATIEAQAGARDVHVDVKSLVRRGDEGLVRTERGLLLKTHARGHTASLAVLGGEAASKLRLPTDGVALGLDVPLARVFDLRMGGLTYFGSVFGVLLGSLAYLRFRKVNALEMFDVMAPTFPLGLFFGRLGCLARGCCWGRELPADSLLPGFSFPAWSPAWAQFARERLTCDLDPLLAKGEAHPVLTQALGEVAQATPPLHATQLYEGIPVLLIFGLLWLYRARWQRRVGQAFALLVLLQAPVRFVVEHMRRDHEVFFTGLGYPLTESQCVAILLGLAAAPAFYYFTRHGRPIVEGQTPPGTAPADGEATGEPAAGAVAPETARG